MASLAIGVLQRQSGDGEPDVRFTPSDDGNDGSALIEVEDGGIRLADNGEPNN